jgi:hypothetical protein
VKGRVSVADENGASLSNALVVGRWTLPDGTTQDASAFSNWNGVASFAATGPRGTYTLTVVNIVLSFHTFDPSHSVLTGTLSVR